MKKLLALILSMLMLCSVSFAESEDDYQDYEDPATCAHEVVEWDGNYTVKDEDNKKENFVIVDENTHKYVGPVYEKGFCCYCESTVTRPAEGVDGGEFFFPDHAYDQDGACRFCGYVSTCEHETLLYCDYEELHYGEHEYYINITETEHTYVGPAIESGVCSACRRIAKREIENYTFTGSHAYIDGETCHACGYNPNGEKNPTHYEIAMEGNNLVLTPDENIVPLEKPMLIVNWDYTLVDGTSFSYTRLLKEDVPGELIFDLGLAEAPIGSVLESVTAIVTDEVTLDITVAMKGYGIAQF